MAVIVVSNTSPISNLAMVGQLTILQEIYSKIIIPTAVYNELTDEGAGDVVATAVQTSIWIETQPVANLTLVTSLQSKVNEGEAEAIALAIELKADELLIDERLGRREATRLGVPITGVLGVLLIAKQRGLIAAVKPVMDELIAQAVFRVSSQLYADILQAAGE
jgi:predicted nucleic acid-binding protein